MMLTGLGLPNEMRQYIKNGTVKEMALWNPIDLYYLTYYVSRHWSVERSPEPRVTPLALVDWATTQSAQTASSCLGCHSSSPRRTSTSSTSSKARAESIDH